MIDLSILICSVHTRYNTFLPAIQKQLYDQYERLSQADQDKVEILILTDNKKMMLGHKRNMMIELAQGKYIVFVDDDDRVADDYISSILEATKENNDAIVFNASVSLNGEPPKICYYSKDYGRDSNEPNAYYRVPNHICCIKKSVSLKSSFPNILYGEDAGYSKVLLPHLETETKIDKVLYYYDYNSNTTETQTWRNNRTNPRPVPPIVDVVIFSKATDNESIRMTQNAVNTCFYKANGLPVNITVIENGDRVHYGNATTLHKPEKFNFNEFANVGAGLGTAEWILIANNDLTFHDGWLHSLIAANNDVVSPHEPSDPRQEGITENESGFECGRHFSGWCFMIKRSLWQKIGKFDTCVDFWFSDNVVIEQVKAAGVTPMLVKDSIVDHAVSKTLRKFPSHVQEDLMWRNADIFNEKYGKDLFKNDARYKAWKVNKDAATNR